MSNYINETMGVFEKEAQAFFLELGCRIWEETGKPLSFHYLLQQIAVAIQRGNAATVLPPPPPSATLTQYLSDRQYFNLHEHTTSVHLINYINLLLATVDAVGRLLVMQYCLALHLNHSLLECTIPMCCTRTPHGPMQPCTNHYNYI